MVRVKVCGLKQINDIQVAIEYGADALGFVLASPHSPRNLKEEEAMHLLKQVPPFVATVVTTASKMVDEVKRLVEALKPDAVQLHGIRGINEVKQLTSLIDCKVIGVASAPPEFDPESRAADHVIVETRELSKNVHAVLFDTNRNGTYGGTGLKGNWSLARKVREAVKPTPMILAGGLSPENVKEAIAVVEPYAVDVSSSVESTSGIKDPAKIMAFLKNAKG